MRQVHPRAGQLPPGLEEALLEHGRAEFILSSPPPGAKDGIPLRDHLEQVVKGSGGAIVPPELETPPLPPEVAHLWEWFADLNGARPSNGFGPAALPYAELDAWARLTGTEPSPWEVSVLKRLDGVYLEVAAGRRTPPGSKP